MKGPKVRVEEFEVTGEKLFISGGIFSFENPRRRE